MQTSQNLTGQNPLLVPPIQYYEGKKVVDLDFKILGRRRNFETKFSFLMNIRIKEYSCWKKEWTDYWWILYQEYEQLIEKKLLNELNSNDKLFIRLFIHSLKTNTQVNQPPLPYFQSRFHLTDHAYYGIKFSNPKLPLVKEVRRQEKTHPLSYIGVGYKDKGSSRNNCWDASPSWQEITSVSSHEQDRVHQRSQFLKKGKTPLVTIELKRSSTMWDPAVKISLREVVNIQGAKEGYVVDDIDHRILPRVFLDSCPEIFWSKIHKKLGTRWTNGKFFLH